MIMKIIVVFLLLIDVVISLSVTYQATTWHDDYNRFRAGVKDLEVMVQNLMSSAFETITTVQEGVEILDIFQHLSSREVCIWLSCAEKSDYHCQARTQASLSKCVSCHTTIFS